MLRSQTQMLDVYLRNSIYLCSRAATVYTCAAKYTAADDEHSGVRSCDVREHSFWLIFILCL